MIVGGEKEVTPKERGALNTLIFEKKRQIESLEQEIAEYEFRTKENRKKIWKHQNDITKLKRLFSDSLEGESLNDTKEKI